jgi:hypothetical protein
VAGALAAHHPKRRGVVFASVPCSPESFALPSLLPLIDRKLYPVDQYPDGQWSYYRFYLTHFEQTLTDFNADIPASLASIYRRGDPASVGPGNSWYLSDAANIAYAQAAPDGGRCATFPGMSTLSEIEAAVDKLPHPEQEILLEHLARKLGARATIAERSRAQRERWLQKLDRLRNRGAAAKLGLPLQEILDDIRGERC